MGDSIESMAGDDDNIDDAPREASLSPKTPGFWHYEPGAIEVGVHHRVPAFDGTVDRRLRKLAAGAADEQIHAPMSRGYFAKDGGDRFCVADIDHDSAGEMAAFAYRLDEAIDLVAVAARHHDMRAEPR